MDIQISTLISIGAVLISLYAVLSNRKKQQNDERVILAKNISDIKKEYAEGLFVFDRILKKWSELDDWVINNKEFLYDDTVSELNKYHDDILRFQSNMKSLYEKLGHQDPLTSDPVILSAIAVESKQIKDSLEQEFHGITVVIEKMTKINLKKLLKERKKKK